MNSKILIFDRSKDRLSRIAERRLSCGDLQGAASAYRAALGVTPIDYGVNADLAEVYYAANMCEEGINSYFRALCYAKDTTQRARALNGLGAGFYFAGKDMLAFHYFSEQLLLDPEGEYGYNDVIDELRDSYEAEMAAESNKPLFRILDGSERDKEDAERIQKSRELMEEDKLNEALLLLAEVNEGGKHFLESLELIGFILISQSRWDVARDIADHILYLDGDNFIGSYVLCCCLFKEGKLELGEGAFARLKSRQTDAEGNLKMVMLSLDIGKDEDALYYMNKVLEETPYSLNILYLKAIAEYNLGRVEECVKGLKSILCFVDSVLVSQRLKEASLPEGERPERLPYDFAMKEAELSIRMKQLSERLDAGKGEKESVEEIIVNTRCIIDCNLLQFLPEFILHGLETDAKAYFAFIRDVMLDAFVLDEVKGRIITELLLYGLDLKISLVAGFGLKKIKLSPRRFEGEHATLCDYVYARIASALYLFDETKVPLFAKKLPKVMEHFHTEDGVKVKPDAICAAVLRKMGFNFISSAELSCALFGVNEKELGEALAMLKKKENANEDI